MKRIITCILCNTFFLLACKAQSVELNKKGANITYETRVANKSLNNINVLYVHNMYNRLYREKQNLPQGFESYIPHLRYERAERKQMTVYLFEVFSKRRVEELSKEANGCLSLEVYLNGKGEIMEVYFRIPRPTSITAKELELMENNIKKKGKVEILQDELKGQYNYFGQIWGFCFKEYLEYLNLK